MGEAYDRLKAYHWSAKIVKTERSEILSEAFWDNPIFDLVYFLEKPFKINIEVHSLSAAFNKYKAFYMKNPPMGFMKVDPDVTKNIVQDHGTIESWINTIQEKKPPEGIPPTVEFVESYLELQRRIKEWSDGFVNDHPAAVDVASRTRHWYYSPIYDTFGPSKFIGYSHFPLDGYTPTKLDGRDTESAIKKLKEYSVLTDHNPNFEIYQKKLLKLLSLKDKEPNANSQIHISEDGSILRGLMFRLHQTREVFSYKYVMLKALLDNIESPEKSVHEYFWMFYKSRKSKGLLLEKKGSSIINTDFDVFKRSEIDSILDAPFEAINNCSTGDPVIIRENAEYRFNQNIIEKLDEHAQEVKEFIKFKLDTYYNQQNGGSLRVWWVNQGKTFQKEREAGYIWAPKANENGQTFPHWKSMIEVAAGDVVINYANKMIVSISLATEKATDQRNEINEKLWGRDGLKIPLDYHDLRLPIGLQEIQPLMPSINETIKTNKPFNTVNGINQGYLYNFSEEGLRKIITEFQDRIPDKILEVFTTNEKNYWIFQANPEIYDIRSVLKNRASHSWTVSRYQNEIKVGDSGFLWQSGKEAGIFAKFVVLKAPGKDIQETDPGGWTTDEKMTNHLRCLINITDIYLEETVTREDLLGTEFGKNLSIIKMPVGTNFKLSREEYERILDMLKRGPQLDFVTYLKNQGYYFSPELINRFVISLRAKPFVILTGNSGTGKTKIAQLFAEYLSPEKFETEIKIPDNDETVTYFKVGKATLKYGVTLPVDSLDFFNIPEIGKPTEVLIHFGGQSEKEYFATFGMPDNREKYSNATIRFRKVLKKYVKENFKIGDYLKLSKVGEKEYTLEKVELSWMPSSEKLTNYVLVPVGANWTDKRHLVGFNNVITQEYQMTACLKLILDASKLENEEYPFFLILDEMNRSHVERYFADFLSAIESDDCIYLHNSPDIEEEEGIPRKLYLPPNLYVIGTVNVDETTYMFSPKVLDRANVIEFPTVSARMYLNGDLTMDNGNKDLSFTGNGPVRKIPPLEIFKTMGNIAISDARTNQFTNKISYEIETFQRTLKQIGFDFGFRVINEMMRYMYIAWEVDGKPGSWDEWVQAFDAQILHKILPKIHGSAKEIRDVLKCLYCLCFSGKSSAQVEKLVKGEVVNELYQKPYIEARYKESARKLKRMEFDLETRRYVSFT
ncbi:MAG: EVE domain-containing protein [Desulfobacteraceae bacterium]|nr:EVE domain-containing protein [Desulfobacteraceae bacterium]MBC2750907.1 EVE domain-containing protein [Desulfobacteraceae bacterium]